MIMLILILVLLSYFILYKVITWQKNRKEWYILMMYGLVDPVLSDKTYDSEENARKEAGRLRELPENSQNSYTYFYVTRAGKIGF